MCYGHVRNKGRIIIRSLCSTEITWWFTAHAALSRRGNIDWVVRRERWEQEEELVLFCCPVTEFSVGLGRLPWSLLCWGWDGDSSAVVVRSQGASFVCKLWSPSAVKCGALHHAVPCAVVMQHESLKCSHFAFLFIYFYVFAQLGEHKEN